MGESRAKNSAYNIISGFTYQLITLILSFISRTVFIQMLGVEYLGINGIFSDVLNLLSMADLGFSTTMAYSFYQPLAERDEKKLTALVCFYRKVYRVIAILVTLLGLAVIPFLPYFIHTEQEIPHLVLYYLFALAGIVISYLFVYKTTILTADQKDYQVVKITIITSLVKTILQIALLLIWKNYILYLAIGIVIQAMNNLIASRKAERSYPYIKRIERLTREEEKQIFYNMKSVFLYKVSGTMFSATDNILISILLGTGMVGVYSNYLMVSNKLLLMIQIIFSALTASIGNLIVTEKTEKKFKVFCTMQSVSFILCGIITSVFCVMANDLVFVWLGETFTISTMAMLALTLNTYLACVLQPLWTYRAATGLYMKTKYIMLLGAMLNIVLSIIMGKIWGLAGILFASAIARLCTYFWYEPKLLFHEYFERKATRYYVSLFLNLLLVVVTIGVLSYLSRRFQVDSWLLLIAKGGGVGVICTLIFGGAYARSKGFLMLMNQLKVLCRPGRRKMGGKE